MRRPLLFSLGLAALLASGAQAQPSQGAHVHFTWDTCDNTTANFVYSGQPSARQIVSLSGYSGTLSTFSVSISLALVSFTNPAWLCALDMWPIVPNGPFASHIQPAASGPCPGIPGLSLNVIPGGCVTLDCANGFYVQGTVSPPVVLDPSTRYALFEIDYSLANCTTWPLDGEQCFAQVGNSLTDIPFYQESDWLLASQSPTGDASPCAGIVPTRVTTWGRLKTIYR